MKRTFATVLAGLTIAAGFALCLSSCTSEAQDKPVPQRAGLANPASVSCIQRGGTLQIVDSPQGQIGICRFPNGRQCEEWALLRGECSPDTK
ncbi:hypothetical protein AWB76_02144 [Caballeronia temeraria]|uniref:Hemolysin n=1 Tax=Caballeronia temeraria TaxID=1777137 RepID=A0A158AC34_9BURK|nr:DUF333 domain-containing protein [Caballeronia temeraria]SAK55265.1 hypothetical protein AWB76_02144 [Caballeronia temeraria]